MKGVVVESERNASGLRFFKGHGLGNDYVALELEEAPFALTTAAIRLLCDRHLGVGSDGILARTGSASAPFGLRIFNPDGSEAEKSGNGLRIFAHYLLLRGEVEIGKRFTVETLGGLVTLEVLERRTDSVLVEVEMGRADFRSGAVTLAGPDREVEGEALELESGDRVTIRTVSIGNPHCVVFEDDMDEDAFRRRAPLIATHPSFARGTNVQFARPIGQGTVQARVWERGAGETSASGSSACAVAAAAVRAGLVASHDVEVRMPGGVLSVHVGDDWELVLRGPVAAVYQGVIDREMIERLRKA